MLGRLLTLSIENSVVSNIQQPTAPTTPTSTVNESTSTATTATTTVAAATTTPTATTTNQPPIPTATQPTTPAAPAPGSVEASLLVGQPPGTVIKCVTAQVIQTTEGPRIVLQGLQGTDFTPNQLAMVHQQVKQQLLKAQATAGKQGVLGPTKIYLAVQPAPNSQPQQNQTAQTSQPPATQSAVTSTAKPQQPATVQSSVPEQNIGRHRLLILDLLYFNMF